MRFLVFALAVISLPVLSLAAAVSLTQDADGFKMSNGELTTRIEERSGRIASVVLGGQELLGKVDD